jgi:Xaa-Pro dipeptidase
MATFLSLGDNYQVPLSMFQENRQKLLDKLDNNNAIVVLNGGASATRFDTDHELLFRQESYFWWLTGVKEPDCAVVITSGSTTLFVPELPPDYATLMGPLRMPDEWKAIYDVDQVQYTHELEAFLENATTTTTTETSSKILLLKGMNTDSGNMYMYDDLAPNFQASSKLTALVDDTTLFPILADCRVFKSPQELALLEHVTQVSSWAHAYVMRNTKPGMYEYQCESLFRHYGYYNYGSRLQSYTNICGCGPNAAVLHYGHAGEPNARKIGPDDNCLFDMGAEYACYASDITCSFPGNGTFSLKYKPLYQAVLDAQIAVYNMAKPGVSFVDCHKAAEAELLKGLAAIGIVQFGDKTVEELVEQRLGAVFMPCGLGHFIGIDTHDVGGYLPGHPERIQTPGLQKLRTARILQANMVLTVEPGLYFIDHLIDGALQNDELAPYLNAELLNQYRGYGGVRLEDVVWITDDGCVNFTLCPRTVEEVEHVMAGGHWPPTQDAAPELRRVKLTTPISPLGPPPSK